MTRTALAALALASLVVLHPLRVDADPLISAPFVTVGVGDVFTVPITITGAVDLQFFQFDLAFAPLIVQANVAGATAGALLPGDWFFTSPGVVDNTAGHILGVSAFGSAFSGSGVIADIEFTALAPGVSPLSLSDVFLNLSDQGFSSENGQITVTGPGTGPPGGTVPEPTTLALLSGGLVLLGVGRRTRCRVVS